MSLENDPFEYVSRPIERLWIVTKGTQQLHAGIDLGGGWLDGRSAPVLEVKYSDGHTFQRKTFPNLDAAIEAAARLRANVERAGWHVTVSLSRAHHD